MTLHSGLDAIEKANILATPFERRSLEANETLFHHGDHPSFLAILLNGSAIGHKTDGAGKRQILSLNIAGDVLGLEHLLLVGADHSTQALTAMEVAIVPRLAIQQLAFRNPLVAHALAVRQAIDYSIAREWLLNIGARDGLRRVAHFLCEFGFRIDARGLKTDAGYELPMSQLQIGQATGLTAIHVNRMLKTLYGRGLIERSWRHVKFASWERLCDVADFSTAYLHPGLVSAVPSYVRQE